MKIFHTMARLAISTSLLLTCAAYAADSSPITLIVPYPPGGPADIVGRAVAPALAESLNTQVIVENRAGASGTIGAMSVVRSKPDGKTLLLNPTIHVIVPSLRSDIPYDAIDDFTHLGVVGGVPLVLAVNKNIPVSTVEELVVYAKQNANKVSYATSGQGSSSHLASEQFRLASNIQIQNVPYKGSAPAITDLIGGHVQMMFDSFQSIFPFVRDGQLKALAVTGSARTGEAPDLPTMIESGFPNFVHNNWYGIWGPANMPDATARKLTEAIQTAMKRDDVRKRLSALGIQPIDGIYGSKFKSFAKSELERYAGIIKSANITIN